MPRGRFVSEARRGRMVELYARGHSRVQIMEMVGASFDTVTAVLRRAGVEIRDGREVKLSRADAEALVTRYRAGEQMTPLAAAFGVTPHGIRKLFDRMGVARRDDRGRRREYTAAEIAIIRQMAADGASQSAIAKTLGSAQTTVSKLMRKEGIAPAWTGAAQRERHYRWRGGRTMHPTGYWQVRLAPSDPFFVMTNRSACVMEHRLVMARRLGRPLTADEEVHHLNGDRVDNRPENLQVRVRPHGSGQCYRCLDCGSTNVVAVHLDDHPEAEA